MGKFIDLDFLTRKAIKYPRSSLDKFHLNARIFDFFFDEIWEFKGQLLAKIVNLTFDPPCFTRKFKFQKRKKLTH